MERVLSESLALLQGRRTHETGSLSNVLDVSFRYRRPVRDRAYLPMEWKVVLDLALDLDFVQFYVQHSVIQLL